ncbi:hypothetical protein TRIUR3_23026 [Triticum urartu]|uniref:Uncharacterized protein n=1 Tax=Triticum urartu TaxID=4572 RepID=M7ZED7_TRIUA|nr:hypothetical protein TRIUR3_23026 [Triticum urartu]
MAKSSLLFLPTPLYFPPPPSSLRLFAPTGLGLSLLQVHPFASIGASGFSSLPPVPR